MDNETLEALKNCPSTDVNFSYLETFFPLSYGIPTILLTIVVIKTILTTKSLKHVFFYQFVVFGTGNSLYWLASLAMDKVLLLPTLCPFYVRWFSKQNIFLKLMYLVYCYAIENYFFAAFAIYAWRVVSIIHYSKIKVLQNHLKMMLVVQFLVPLSMFWIFLNATVYYGFIQPGTPRIWFLYTSWPYIEASAVSGIMFGFLSLVIITSSLMMVYRICRIKKHNGNWAERNIMITCLTFSVSAAAICLYQSAVFYFISLVTNRLILSQILSIRGYVIDVASLLPTWCLLLTSTEIRQKIFKNKLTNLQHVSSTRVTVATN